MDLTLIEEFIKYAKDVFGISILTHPTDEYLTFEQIFDMSSDDLKQLQIDYHSLKNY